jgi:FkbM family methyltransferase
VGEEPSLPDRLTLTVGDEEVHFDTSSKIAKDWFYPRYRNGRAHEEVVFDLLLDRLDSDSCFFDVGANLGFYSAVASRHCRTGNVHSFEMDPDLIGEIWKNLDCNGAEDGHVTCAAVWEDNGTLVSFSPHINGNKSTNQVAVPTGERSTHVPSLAIDTYCVRYDARPDVVKIDVEGAELQVLRGMEATLPNVSTLFLEVHPDHLLGNTSLTDIEALLLRFDFALDRILEHRHGDELQLERLRTLESVTENTMLLCERA